MKTRALIVAAAAATTAFGHDAFAQSMPPDAGTTFGAMVGTEEVTGAIKNASSGVIHPGIVVGALGQFPVGAQLAVRADAMFHDIRDGCANVRSACGASPYSSYVVSGSVLMIARLNGPATRWSPYVLGGVGVYTYEFQDGNIKALRPSHFGLEGGVGFEMRPRAPMPRAPTVFIEARYMDIAPGGVVPLTIGMRF